MLPMLLAGDLAGRVAAQNGDIPLCKECLGSGVVSCDMCGGTGKWRALSRKRTKVLLSLSCRQQAQRPKVMLCPGLW